MDYPTAKEFKVYVKVKNLIDPVDPDYTPLKEAIAETKQNLGENIYASTFYQPALSIISPSWIVQTIEIQKKAGGERTLEIESYYDELWSCSVDDVVIEEGDIMTDKDDFILAYKQRLETQYYNKSNANSQIGIHAEIF